VLERLHEPRVDRSPAVVHAMLLDEGEYLYSVHDVPDP